MSAAASVIARPGYGSGAKGFEVAETTADGVRLRRLSDGEILPVEFPEQDVRKESRRNDFWWM